MTVKIRDALKEAVDRIVRTGSQTPLLDAEVLLCSILAVDRLYLIINGNQLLTEEQLHKFQLYIKKRMAGVPVQYIVGRQEFMGLDFLVEEGVLIPRPDTEILVESVLEWISEKHGKTGTVRIADIGTGSGAIAISLAKLVIGSDVYAVDISPKAIKIAGINREKHQVMSKTTFLLGDLLDPLKDAGLWNKLDVLVSNPPYIPIGDIPQLQLEVAGYEPILALDGGADGLDFYKRLVEEGWALLKNGGLLAFEMGHNQADDIKKLLEENGRYTNIRIIRDLAGIQRVITAETIK